MYNNKKCRVLKPTEQSLNGELSTTMVIDLKSTINELQLCSVIVRVRVVLKRTVVGDSVS